MLAMFEIARETKCVGIIERQRGISKGQPRWNFPILKTKQKTNKLKNDNVRQDCLHRGRIVTSHFSDVNNALPIIS